MDSIKKWKLGDSNIIKYVLLNLVGVTIYSLGINNFAAPHKIAPGGASGIAILVNYLTGFPIGLFVFLFNIPLLWIIIRKKYFSISFVVGTILSTMMLSIVTDYVVVKLPAYKGNPLLASMFCGGMMGIGLALVHLGRANTGGISLLGLIMRKYNPKFPVGTWTSCLNAAVVLASSFVYKNLESMLYAVVTVYISGIFMDRILKHADAKNLMIVITESTDKIRDVFLSRRVGATLLQGEGGYAHGDQKIVICVSEKKQCEIIERQIQKIDNQALVIITEAEKVTGKGFRHLS